MQSSVSKLLFLVDQVYMTPEEELLSELPLPPEIQTCLPHIPWYTCQRFYIYRHDIFYLKSAKIFRMGPIISEDVRRRSEDVTKSSV